MCPPSQAMSVLLIAQTIYRALGRADLDEGRSQHPEGPLAFPWMSGYPLGPIGPPPCELVLEAGGICSASSGVGLSMALAS